MRLMTLWKNRDDLMEVLDAGHTAVKHADIDDDKDVDLDDLKGWILDEDMGPAILAVVRAVFKVCKLIFKGK